MSMSVQDERYIRQELEKRFPDLNDDLDKTYRMCNDVNYALDDDPQSWKLIQMLDADTLEMKWMWVKKS